MRICRLIMHHINDSHHHRVLNLCIVFMHFSVARQGRLNMKSSCHLSSYCNTQGNRNASSVAYHSIFVRNYDLVRIYFSKSPHRRRKQGKINHNFSWVKNQFIFRTLSFQFLEKKNWFKYTDVNICIYLTTYLCTI